MEITHIPAGSRSAADIDEVLAEVVDFATIINRASGLGTDFDPRSDEVRQELLSDDGYVTHQTWIGRLGGAIVATGIAYLTLRDNLDLADVWCSVHPELRGQGLGSELLAEMEASLAAQGRTQLTSYCEIPTATRDADLRGAHLAAESGAGSVTAAQPDVAFLSHHGFAFKQLERCSVAKTATAAKLSRVDLNAGYTIETWTGPTPEHRLEQIAFLHQKMSTDTPDAEELGEEESWDAARVRALDAKREENRELVATALALKGESAAGFTEVAHFDDRPRVGWQGSTLVVRDHRGHGLGAALKIANQQAVGESTQVERIYTWNAVENSWMLAINDRAGFATWAWVGLWKKRLA
ncbi:MULTISPECIES: GNAT family N-acetyltransferase [Brevibacterium]|uniref:Acetyltransferase (GNAT) family protein n=2 Tax=Brevibacterium TaxID=1696 RepID=A0A1H1MBU4_BRESA|nr:GNAT family N-acetyltransferase [Brevibacterium sandarakinum]SDR84238.1 Acetyltransferase (GNAT) family protein [Brevibacterium sandarakinum]